MRYYGLLCFISIGLATSANFCERADNGDTDFSTERNPDENNNEQTAASAPTPEVMEERLADNLPRTGSDSSAQTAPNNDAINTAQRRSIGSAQIQPVQDQPLSGRVDFFEEPAGTMTAKIVLTGLEPNSVHAVHIHENGDCGNEGNAAGAHFNPTNAEHGAPGDTGSHIGDFGNVSADTAGAVNTTVTKARPTGFEEGWTLIHGKAVIVHSGQDDLVTQPSGNAGDRIGCGIISSSGSIEAE